MTCSLPSGFIEIIGNIFPLHTHKHTHTHTHTHKHKNTHINFYLLWHWTSSASEYILFFLVAFNMHMQGKKSSPLLNVSNFSKTKGLSGNQALNKNSSNSKKQKTKSIHLRIDKNFFRDV